MSRRAIITYSSYFTDEEKKAKCGYCKKEIFVSWNHYRYDHVECGDCTSQGREAYACNDCAEKHHYDCIVCGKEENMFPPQEMWTSHPNHWGDSIEEEEV
ncbi:MAG: hypothetical protein ACTSVO_00720 [Candidatus Heimdallarchaeaceae archaeon]